MVRVYLGEMQFPIPPEEIRMAQEGNNSRVLLQNIGEITKLRAPAQKTISFSGFFPESGGFPFGEETPRSPQEYAGMLQGFLAAKKQQLFVVSGTAQPCSMPVTVEKLTLREAAGDVGTVFYELTLREYRTAQVTTTAAVSAVNAAKPSSSKPVREDNRPVPASHTVVKGDSLWAIARRYLGSGSRYGELARYNGIKNPNLIYPGQVVKIPV